MAAQGFLLCTFAVATTAIALALRSARLRRIAIARLEGEETVEPDLAPLPPPVAVGPLRRTWFVVPWIVGIGAALAVWFFLAWPAVFPWAIGVIVAILGWQAEAYLASRKAARLERQLADAIDLMVGALGAGAGATAALEAALEETANPLRTQLAEVLGRIRLGDDPQAVFRALAKRIPLETFLLFSSALAVHWEVGGTLAPTLATVGRTIRDRIELARRIHSNAVMSQFSAVVVTAITYFLALVSWLNAPDQLEQFLATSVGSTFVAITMVLQALGFVWMSWISKPRF
jgi:Flp pilus assembly protein TadB